MRSPAPAPSRRTRTVGTDIRLSAAIDCSARYSCVKPRIALRTTMARMTTASIQSPSVTERTTAARRMKVMTLINCSRTMASRPRPARSVSSLAPVVSRRAAASDAPRPATRSTARRRSTSSALRRQASARALPRAGATGSFGRGRSVTGSSICSPALRGPLFQSLERADNRNGLHSEPDRQLLRRLASKMSTSARHSAAPAWVVEVDYKPAWVFDIEFWHKSALKPSDEMLPSHVPQ